jgi:hypothetical protein
MDAEAAAAALLDLSSHPAHNRSASVSVRASSPIVGSVLRSQTPAMSKRLADDTIDLDDSDEGPVFKHNIMQEIFTNPPSPETPSCEIRAAARRMAKKRARSPDSDGDEEENEAHGSESDPMEDEAEVEEEEEAEEEDDAPPGKFSTIGISMAILTVVQVDVPFTVPSSDGKSSSALSIPSNTLYQSFLVKIAIATGVQLDEQLVGYQYSNANKSERPTKITRDVYPRLMQFAISHVLAEEDRS